MSFQFCDDIYTFADFTTDVVNMIMPRLVTTFQHGLFLAEPLAQLILFIILLLSSHF